MSQQSSASWQFETTIASDTSIGSGLVNGLLEAMECRGWSMREMFRVQLAYEEAIVNAIRHGNKFSEEKTVDVAMSCNEELVLIRIKDMGSGFDLTKLPDPRDDDRLEIPGGRGVMLIHELMSEVTYNETGNEVTMWKRHGEDPEIPEESDNPDQ